MATTEIKNERQSDSICRLCLTKGEHHQLIFTGDRSALGEWIENLTTLKITKIPNAPASLCLECEITLQNFESFREMCLTNDQVYKDMITNDFSKDDHMAASNETLQVDEVKVAYDKYHKTGILDNEISQKYVLEIKMEYPDIKTAVTTKLNSQENIGDEIRKRTASQDSKKTQKLKNNNTRSKPTNRKKSHICRFCAKAFIAKSKLIVHIRTHTKEKPFKCNECDRCFATNGCLKRHELLHTDIRPFECDMCPARYTQPFYLQWHKKVHAEGYTKKGREKQCPICKEYVRRLPLHYRAVHNEQRLFQCQYCPQGFHTQSRLKIHIRRHTKEIPFVCSHCDKGFLSSSEMMIHERSHTLERPYKCDSCDKAFVTKNVLRRHQLTHSKIKPFTCDICQASFTLKQGFRRHQNVHHPKKAQPSSTDIAAEVESKRDAEDVKNF